MIRDRHRTSTERLLLVGEDDGLLARIIERMGKSIRTPGAEVLTPSGQGAVVDIRATPAGEFIVGVAYADGEVRYFIEKALHLAQR